MGKKKLVANRQYTDEFKVEAVRLGGSIGGNQAAKRLGIPESSLWNWIRLSRAGKLKAADGTAVRSKHRFDLKSMCASAASPRRSPAQWSSNSSMRAGSDWTIRSLAT